MERTIFYQARFKIIFSVLVVLTLLLPFQNCERSDLGIPPGDVSSVESE